MKKIDVKFRILAIILAVFSLSSCKEDFFDVRTDNGAKDETVAFNVKDDFESAVIGCYVNLQGAGAAGDNYIRVPGYISQDIVFKTAGVRDLNNYMSPSNIDAFQTYWREAYRIVTQTNLVLDKLSSVNPGVLTAQEKKIYSGQAKFLRGYAYFIIARAYGDVPMFLTKYSNVQNSIGCTPRNKVFEQVVKDLTEAAAELPEAEEYEPKDRGRVTKGAALAYLANAYMYLEDWSKAKTATEDLMALTKPKYALATNLNAPFSYANNRAPAYLKENIFEVQYKRGKDPTFWERDNTNANFWGSFLGAYTSPDGIGTTFDSYRGWGELVINKKAMDSFEPNDRRINTLYVNWGAPYEGEYFPRPMTQADWNRTRQRTVGFTTKYWLGNYTTGLDLYPQGLPQMRFTEVVLNYAEILYKTGSQTGAYTELNKIRTRARLPNKPISLVEATFMQELMDERRHELLLEPNLWFHYTRTKLAAKFLFDNYQITMKPEWNFFPIPIRDRTLNPALCSNGY